MLGGHIEAVTVSENEVSSGLSDGSLRVLTSMGLERGSLSKNVPTLNEMGKDLTMMGWGAFAVPANTPDSVLKVLVPAAQKILQSKDFQEQVAGRGLVPGYQSAEDMQKFAESQYIFFAPLIKELNLR